MTAHEHFMSVGQAEGRVQCVNVAQVIGMRDWKFERLRFKAPLRLEREPGAPANFLSPALISEFGIPETPPISANPYGAPIVQVIHDNPDHLFLDVGAGLRETYYRNVVNTEIYPSASTDVLCVGESMPFDDDLFDHVFCFATLEHTRRPWDVAREICRVLKPGGTAFIDYPFLQPVHGYPHHYFNATPLGNQSLFEESCDILSLDIGWHQHPMIGVQWSLTAFRKGLPNAEGRKFEALRIKDIIECPVETLLEEDYCRGLDMDTRRVIASGSMLVAEKRSAPADVGRVRADPVTRPPRRPSFGTNATAVGILREHNALLQRQLDEMHRSTSWKITAPLRAIRRLVRAGHA